MVLSNLFSSVIEVSLTMSIVIVALLVLRAVIKKKLTAKWSCFVWLLIALRLALPFNIAIPNVAFQIQPPVSKAITVTKENQDAPNITTDKQPVSDTAIPNVSKDDTQESSAQPTAPQISKPQTITINYMAIAAWIWIIGMLLIAGYQVVSYLIIKGRINRFSTKVTNQRVLATYERLRQDLNLKKKIPIKLCKQIATPMLVGFIKPIIILPTVHYSEQECYGILKHECVHQKRHDPLFKLLLMVVQTIHWFNPFVYAMSYFAKQDIELACDAEVIKQMDFSQRKEYSLTLLNSLEEQVNCKTRLTAAFSEDKRTVKDRFKQIFDTGKKKKGIFALIVIVLVVAIGGSLLMFGTREVKQVNDSLTIYVNQYMEQKIRIATMKFRNEFPNVKLNIVDLSKLSYEEYLTKVQADIQSGNGPDLLWTNYGNFKNIYKSIDAGVFCDLNPMIEQDKDFDLSEYNTTIMDAGIYKGIRYILPQYYNMPYLLTTQEILNETKIDISKCNNFVGLSKDLDHYLERNDKKVDMASDNVFWFSLYLYSGLDVVNYEENKVDLNEKRVKEVLELYKSFYQKGIKKLPLPRFSTSTDAYDFLSQKKQCFYFDTMLSPNTLFLNAGALCANGHTPILLPVKTIDGQIQAEVSAGVGIRNNSKNKQNAFEFIKILLSPQLQQSPFMSSGFPVRNQSLHTLMSEWRVESGSSENYYGQPFIYEELPQEFYLNIIRDIENVGEVKLYESNGTAILFDYLQPFFENEKSYEECMKEAKSQLEIYVTQ